jgi:hypothetical protein
VVERVAVRLNIPSKTQKMFQSQGVFKNDKRVPCFTTATRRHMASTLSPCLFSFYFQLRLLKGTELMIYLRGSGYK